MRKMFSWRREEPREESARPETLDLENKVTHTHIGREDDIDGDGVRTEGVEGSGAKECHRTESRKGRTSQRSNSRDNILN